MRWVGHVTCMGGGEKKCLHGFGWGLRAKNHWEDLGVGVIKMDLREIGIDGANWIQLAHDRVRCRRFCEHGD
jgi:hypothetical protein